MLILIYFSAENSLKSTNQALLFITQESRKFGITMSRKPNQNEILKMLHFLYLQFLVEILHEFLSAFFPTKDKISC